MQGTYNFETRMANINRDFGQRRGAQDRAQFMGQQRFSRQREGFNRDFGRQFPRFTGQAAGRLGSGVQSGVFRQQLGQQVGDFNRLLQDLDIESGTFQSQGEFDRAELEAARQRQLDELMAEYGQSRASYNPFANI